MPAIDVYVTVSGDTWDGIAYIVYGDETQMAALLTANPAVNQVTRFDAGVQIVCPDIAIVQSSDLPAWRSM